MTPPIYKFWCSSAQDIYDERIAIGRADARISDDQPTPQHIEDVAREQARQEHNAVILMQTTKQNG